MKLNSESIQVKARMSEAKGPHLFSLFIGMVVGVLKLSLEGKGSRGGGRDLHYIC